MKRVSALLVLLIVGVFASASWGQSDPSQSGSKDSANPASAPPAAAPAAASASTPAPPPRPRAHFVPVLVSATDASGNPATGLTKEQFSILDTMQPVQPIQVFKGADIPLHLAVVLLAAPGSFSQQQAAAIDLVQKVVRPKIDEAFVVTARGKKPWPSDRLEWKQDPAEVVKIIEGLDRNAGLADAFTFNVETSETELIGRRSSIQTYATGGVSVFDAVYSMMNSDPRPARRVIVIFREAWAHSQGFGQQVNTVVEDKLTQVIGVAQELHIATFVIGLEDPRFNGITDNNLGKNYIPLHMSGGSGGAAYDTAFEKAKLRAYEGGKTNVQRLAAESGGAAFWSVKKNYTDAVTSIANLLAGQYIVTFTPSDVATPVHTLKVTAGAGTKMLAQSTFFYGAPK
jgi:VWFA-related protein